MTSPIPIDTAIEKINKMKNEYYFRRDTEKISIYESTGRELSETIFAGSMSPVSDIAAMDGFAVCSGNGYPLKITDTAYAGDDTKTINPGEAMAIATGAFMPRGADAVLKIEDSEVKGKQLFGKTLLKWENVFRAGADYCKGDRIFEKNHRIMPQSCALLYSLGVGNVPVYRKLRAGIISTGTEIHNGMIKNTSSILIDGFMKEFGCESTFIGTVPDDYDRTLEMVVRAAGKYDVVITTGGVSVGERDYVADIIKDAGELVFHRVAIRPGKPLAVGIINDTPVFGLPGKPTGAFAALEMVIRHYFTCIPRAKAKFIINEDIALKEKGFNYILFVKLMKNRAHTMGYKNSGMALFEGEYDTVTISASPRSTIVDGYVVTDRDIKKGEPVKVSLFS
ncbi:MAG: molybdopterin molybdotransferase MoeA [Candidatus Methanoperedens sp.]